jgi:uncharacterized OsmC-like protein
MLNNAKNLFLRNKLNMRNLLQYSKYNFAQIKNFKSTTVAEGTKEKTSIPDLNDIHIKTPLDVLMGALSACEVHSILFQAKKDGVKIEKVEVDAKGQYDLDVYLEKTKGKNTYTQIDVEARIKSSESDKKKLEEVVQKGEELCPVLSTLRLAGIKINSTIKYI